MSNFEEAVAWVQNSSGNASINNDLKLTFYKLYKQATVGDCNTAAPGLLHVKEKAKWEAWNSAKGMTAEEAKKRYVDELNAAVPSWNKS